jgi:hypothetical protein
MPRMSDEELYEILDKALTQVGMTIDEPAKIQVARLAKGLPHYAHLLGQQSALAAIMVGRTNITKSDISDAINALFKTRNRSVISAYNTATTSPRENLYKQVLLACALAKTDDLGFFSAAAVRDPMSKIMKRRYDSNVFTALKRLLLRGARTDPATNRKETKFPISLYQSTATTVRDHERN